MAARYAELAQELIEAIKSGQLPVGSSLPSEVDLSVHYGVSRATLRSALVVVQNLGLISRRKRAGIRVESSRPAKPYERSLSDLDELMQFATVTERQVQSITSVTADQTLADQLKCDVLQKWLRVSMLRVDPQKPDAPLCWTDVYLEPTIGKGLRSQLRNSSGLICEMVETKFGCTVQEVRQDIRAIGVPPAIASALSAEPNAMRWKSPAGI